MERRCAWESRKRRRIPTFLQLQQQSSLLDSGGGKTKGKRTQLHGYWAVTQKGCAMLAAFVRLLPRVWSNTLSQLRTTTTAVTVLTVLLPVFGFVLSLVPEIRGRKSGVGMTSIIKGSLLSWPIIIATSLTAFAWIALVARIFTRIRTETFIMNWITFQGQSRRTRPHLGTFAASSRLTTSSMDQTWSEIPASIAGVTRKVW